MVEATMRILASLNASEYPNHGRVRIVAERLRASKGTGCNLIKLAKERMER
jgi:hypothetical protein